ncbi:unnamed protein product [Dicrocoelium dendriticum]|nr:unnamed protein product [Dicrocoelium dendriticum]
MGNVCLLYHCTPRSCFFRTSTGYSTYVFYGNVSSQERLANVLVPTERSVTHTKPSFRKTPSSGHLSKASVAQRTTAIALFVCNMLCLSVFVLVICIFHFCHRFSSRHPDDGRDSRGVPVPNNPIVCLLPLCGDLLPICDPSCTAFSAHISSRCAHLLSGDGAFAFSALSIICVVFCVWSQILTCSITQFFLFQYTLRGLWTDYSFG